MASLRNQNKTKYSCTLLLCKMCLCTRATYQLREALDGQHPGCWEVDDLAGQSLLISNIPGQNNLVKASSSRNASCPQLCVQIGSMDVTLKCDHLLGTSQCNVYIFQIRANLSMFGRKHGLKLI